MEPWGSRWIERDLIWGVVGTGKKQPLATCASSKNSFHQASGDLPECRHLETQLLPQENLSWASYILDRRHVGKPEHETANRTSIGFGPEGRLRHSRQKHGLIRHCLGTPRFWFGNWFGRQTLITKQKLVGEVGEALECSRMPLVLTSQKAHCLKVAINLRQIGRAAVGV